MTVRYKGPKDADFKEYEVPDFVLPSKSPWDMTNEERAEAMRQRRQDPRTCSPCSAPPDAL